MLWIDLEKDLVKTLKYQLFSDNKLSKLDINFFLCLVKPIVFNVETGKCQIKLYNTHRALFNF